MREANNKNTQPKAGYEYLLAYKLTVPIYDYTVEFCNRWVSKFSRTTDQMTQAARSGLANIAEGNKQQSLKGYIKLVGVARGSLEELLKDYHAFARQNGLRIWGIGETRDIREIGVIWEIIKRTPTLPDQPNLPNLPENKEIAVNLQITLINQANMLLDKLATSLKQKHKTQGGLTEELYQSRKEYRGY